MEGDMFIIIKWLDVNYCYVGLFWSIVKGMLLDWIGFWVCVEVVFWDFDFV